MALKPRIELITLGDELLLGLRTNGHLNYLGQELSKRGLSIRRNTVLTDNADDIANEFKHIWEQADVIITTGGLGPTSDDNTREAIATSLGLSLELDPWAEEALETRFKNLNRQISDRDRKQCYKPKGAEVLSNRLGTAPGIYLKKDGKLLFMLPGPTHELRHVFIQSVLPRLRDEGLVDEKDAYAQIRTFGIREGRIEDHLGEIIQAHPGMGLAFCAHQGLVDVRLSAGEAGFNPKQLKSIAAKCQEALGEHFVCEGNSSLAQVVADQLRAMEKTLAIAESCTGGLLADAFTNIPGISKIFSGGMIGYTNDSKVELIGVPEPILQQHGAVSEECAVAMATGVAERLSTDYGLSITGYAGPDFGSATNPVGTIYVGYHSPIGAWAHKVVFPGERQYIKARAVNTAIDFMRRKLTEYKLAEFIHAEAGSI